MRFFETIGSAIVIAYDDRPVLTTDPWINGAAYFGSWGQDYEIPAEQMQAIRDADYHWFSHGHPDHLNVASLPLLTKGEFLLSDHYGNRIKRDLTAAGYRVRVLPDREWIQLSKGIRVYSIANQNQDSLLLIDVNGRLIINQNDSPEFGECFRVRRMAKHFKEVYMLQLHGWGGADMLNLFDPTGQKLTSIEEKRRPIAPRAQIGASMMARGRSFRFRPSIATSVRIAHGPTFLSRNSRIITPAQSKTGPRFFRLLSRSTVKQMKSRRSTRRDPLVS
jgi:hypothetical protein